MRRTLALLLCLLLLPAASAETYLVNYYNADSYNGTALLLRDDGSVLIEPYTYSNLYEVTLMDAPEADRRYCAARITVPDRSYTEEELWSMDEAQFTHAALLDASGTPLTGFDYFSFDWDEASGQIVFWTPERRCGAMDMSGNVLLEADYFALSPNGEGGWLALDRGGESSLEYDHYYPIVYIDAQGVKHETGYHTQPGGLEPFSEGLCLARWLPEFDGKSIYLGPDGVWAFEGAYSYAESFHGGTAVANPDEEKSVLIDDRGNVLTEGYGYLSFCEFGGDAVYYSTRDGRFTLLDAATGACRRDVSYPGVNWVYAWGGMNGLIPVTAGDQTDLYDFSGALLFSCKRDSSDGINVYRRADALPQRVSVTQGEWPHGVGHMVDLHGRSVSGDFQSLSPAIWQDGQGRVETMGYQTRWSQDDEPYEYPDWDTARYGVCDADGNEILPMRYRSLTVLGLDRYWVRQDSRCGMIDSQGNWIYTISDYQFLMD